MDNFFSPKSVAVVGASATPGKTGHEVLKNIINGGFEGKIYPINPRESEILGKVAYKSLNDTPQKTDLVVIVIPAKYVPAVVQEGALLGIKNFVIITAGFGEIGEAGAYLDVELKKLVEKHDLHVMGPNCLGVIAPHSKLNAAFGGGLPPAGNVALVSQSGAIVSSLADWAGVRNFGFSKMVSLGNTLQLNENECLEYLEQDDNTKVIVLFLKHFKDKSEFLKLCTRIGKQKTIILYQNEPDKALTEELLQAGVLQVSTVEDLYNLTYVCSTLPIPKGNNVTVVTNAGGPGAIADEGVKASQNLKFAAFSEAVQQELVSMLPAEALPLNPLDLIGDAKADLYEKSLEILLRNKTTDSLLVILSPQAMTQAKESAQAVIAAKQMYLEIPMLACFMGGTSAQEGIDMLMNNGIPCFLDPLRALWALEKLEFIRQIRS